VLHGVKGVQNAVLASVRNTALFSAMSFEFFQTLLVHFLFVDRHLRSDAAILHSSTLVFPYSVADLNTKCVLLSRHQNARQNHEIKIGDRSFENVAQFRYLGTTEKA
jgi:hypothetical protein